VITLTRALIIAVAALASLLPMPAQASPPAIAVTGRPDPGTFTVVLRGVSALSGAAHSGSGLVVLPVAGVLTQPSGRVLFTHPLPGIADIVVAQHDPGTVWVVAHLTTAKVPFTVASAPSELRVVFGHPQTGAEAASAAPAPAAPVIVSVNWTDVRLSDALADLAATTSTMIIADIGIDGRVTLKMDQVRLDQVLQAIAAQLHVHLVQDATGYWLTTSP